ncbi:hypothetical protein CLV31_109133 [Algoriphagus aquaeductus]|uniref:Uncharacterized protein n=1 Tax=Algoriphagus aquaeductus TaxID=475299 RepID=A0A326RNQ0_9BACT|nr:hypothetical protein [Algoriphagus aquaeductus]PZV82272.1 hypothetical protein CLV31_109133 [Algoriphagus aquaeductus]
MPLLDLDSFPTLETNPKISAKLQIFRELLRELKSRNLPESALDSLNQPIKNLNDFLFQTSHDPSTIIKQIQGNQRKILKFLEKNLGLTTKNHYQNMWMPLGMSAFGLPFGVVFGIALDNMAFLGLGLPIGMALGIAMGSGLDQKAAKEGKQLRFEPK